MEIISNREEMIFRKDFEGTPRYTLGLSKKDKDGNYEKGYITVKFKQGVELNNQTKIKIKNAWLSFNQRDNKTYPYIFINDFSIANEPELKTKTFSDFGEQIKITDEDLPF